MMREDDARSQDFLLGMLIGTALGAAAALLYAPFRGRETRDYLSNRMKEGLDKASEVAEMGQDALNRARDAVIQGRDSFMSAVGQQQKQPS